MRDTNKELFKLVLPYDYERMLNDYFNDNGLDVVVYPIHREALTEILKQCMLSITNDKGEDLLDEVLNKFKNFPRTQSNALAAVFWVWVKHRTANDVWDEINNYIEFKIFCGGPDTTYDKFNEHKVNLGELAENWEDFSKWSVNDDPNKNDFIAIFRGVNNEEERTFVKVSPDLTAVVMTNRGEA